MKYCFFTEKNVALLFISPYTHIRSNDDSSVFYNTLTNVQICLPLRRAMLDDLLDKIRDGISYEELVSVFEKYQLSEDWIVKLMQEGVLE